LDLLVGLHVLIFQPLEKIKELMATMVSYQKHILNSFAKKNPIFLFLKM